LLLAGFYLNGHTYGEIPLT